MGRKIIHKIINELTPEKIEKMRQKHIEQTKLLTLEYQLGYYVGEFIGNTSLPSIDTDYIHTNNLIPVTKEEKEKYELLDKLWAKRYEHDGLEDTEEWRNCKEFEKELHIKYLPPVLVCYLEPLNVENVSEFKRGIRFSLWNSDICHYKIENDDDIIIENDGFYTIIKLNLDF